MGFALPKEDKNQLLSLMRLAGRRAEKIKPGCPHRGQMAEKHLGVTAPQGIPVRYQDIPPLPKKWPGTEG